MTPKELSLRKREVRSALSHARFNDFPTRQLMLELEALKHVRTVRPIYNGWSNLGPATRKRFYRQGEF